MIKPFYQRAFYALEPLRYYLNELLGTCTWEDPNYPDVVFFSIHKDKLNKIQKVSNKCEADIKEILYDKSDKQESPEVHNYTSKRLGDTEIKRIEETLNISVINYFNFISLLA